MASRVSIYKPQIGDETELKGRTLQLSKNWTRRFAQSVREGDSHAPGENLKRRDELTPCNTQGNPLRRRHRVGLKGLVGTRTFGSIRQILCRWAGYS
jgi:hypothetical protein